MTPESVQALRALRHPGTFDWSIVNQLAFVLYVYASALRRGEWDKVVLGVGFWAVEFLWEMANALVLFATDHAALWTIGAPSTLLIYVGLNVEIALMFAVAPMVLLHVLPKDQGLRIAGMPNRLVIPIAFGLFCVAVECLLNQWGVLVWRWPFWRWPHLWLVVLAYCGPFWALGWLYDRTSLRQKQWGALVAIVAALVAHLLLAEILGWV